MRITGRVQGVFYRASTRDTATRLGLVGWVRNTHDGAVEIEAEGPPDRVESLHRWCHRGPPAAHVAGVEIAEIEPTGTDTAFRVAY